MLLFASPRCASCAHSHVLLTQNSLRIVVIRGTDGLESEVGKFDILHVEITFVCISLAHCEKFFLHIATLFFVNDDASAMLHAFIRQIVTQLIGIILSAVKEVRLIAYICSINGLNVCKVDRRIIKGRR